MAWTKETIRAKLIEDDRWLERGLIAIYKKQTAEEQTHEITNRHNEVGFNKFDAKFLTSLAKDFMRYGNLTPKQKKWARKKIPKYSGQLCKIANGEI